jgi:MFS transporter, DHA1 family, inner membrane transport protein
VSASPPPAPSGPVTATPPAIGPTLVRLVGAKTVANTALRWLPLFLPTLEPAFSATTTQLTTVLGAGELAGLSTVASGSRLDRGRERLVLLTSMGLLTASTLIALVGTLTSFAVSFFVLVLAVSNYTVAGQTWISHRVGYARRARALGLYETSWALALLVGAPIVAVLINVFGWRGPFVALAAASAVATIVIASTLPRWVSAEPGIVIESAPHVVGEQAGAVRSPKRAPITVRAWLVMTGSAATAMAGLGVFVVSGSWLDDAFGIPTSGIGAVAVGFGAAELVSSLASAGLADRVGKLRSTIAGLLLLLVGLAVMVSADTRVVVGVIGILTFLLGFEYAFVTSLSLVSEAMPDARGTTLAVSNAVGTIARAAGAVGSGWLYSAHGITGTATMSALCAVAAIGCLVLSRRSPVRRSSRLR